MTTKTIRHGITHVVSGTLAAGDRLNIQGGVAGDGAGGAAIVQTNATSAGLIDISGGQASTIAGQEGAMGALLQVDGLLINSGTILVDVSHGSDGNTMNGDGGTLIVSGVLVVQHSGSVVVAGASGSTHYNPAGSSALFVNSGTVSNAGTVTLDSGGPQSFNGGVPTDPAPAGAMLSNSGTFRNYGSLLLEGSSYTVGSQPALSAAQFIDSGVLTNAGDIVVGGAITGSIYYSNAGFGATLSVDGVLVNAGSILVGGGAGSSGRYFNSGYGGLLVNSGTLSNAGVIELAAGAPSYYGGGGAGTLVSSLLLTNTGTILVDGAKATGLLAAGDSGYLDLNGPYQSVALNAGLMSIGGGGGSRYGFGSAAGGVLNDSASLTNTGTILIGGGLATTTVYGSGGLGGSIIVDGTLTNSGTISVGGGQGANLSGAFGSGAGQGGVIEINSGYFFNDGNLLLQGGTGGHAGGGTGASLTVSQIMFQNDSGTLTVGASKGGSSGVLMLDSEIQNDPRSLVENDGRILFGPDGGTILGGIVHNTGVISGSGDLSELTFTNDGVVDVGSGDVLLDGDIISASAGGHGTLMVGTGGLLTIDGSTTINASQSVVLENATAVVSITGQEAGVPIVSALGGALDIVSPGDATLNAADTNLDVYLVSPTDLTLSKMSGIEAFGSSKADRITALSAGQTLTGRGGADILTGSSADGDVFKDTASGLDGDTIGGFAGSDVIDITDLVPNAGLSLIYTQGSGSGTLTASEGTKSTTFTLLGSFMQGQFTTASDGHGGLLIGLH
jgi:hypothetical protein